MECSLKVSGNGTTIGIRSFIPSGLISLGLLFIAGCQTTDPFPVGEGPVPETTRVAACISTYQFLPKLGQGVSGGALALSEDGYACGMSICIQGNCPRQTDLNWQAFEEYENTGQECRLFAERDKIVW